MLPIRRCARLGDHLGTGYFTVPDEVAARTDITASAKLIYGQILRRIGKNTHAWPSAGSLAKDTGMGLGVDPKWVA